MKISVALCTYNGEKYLSKQLDSILSQSIAVDEIIVCDDHSNDSTFTILKQYATKHPNIFKIHRNEKNLGYVKNFEKAILYCTGDVIFLSDQDDIWYKNKVEMVTKIISENPKIKVICHNLNLTKNLNKEHNYWKWRNFFPPKNNNEILEMLIFSGNIFPGMSMAITKNAVEKYFPLLKSNKLIIHDFELLIKSCRDNSLYLLNEILADYRLHNQQNIGLKTKVNIEKITLEHVYDKHKSISYIQKMIEDFQLNPLFLEQYKVEIKNHLNTYLQQLPLWKRGWIKLKLKYYFNLK